MKKRDLILAGALLLGFGLNVQAQTEEETLFFYGFEDDFASFRDSSKAVDSITQIRYYDGTISNGAGASVYPTDLTIAYVKDSLLLQLHGISPWADRQDTYELIRDQLGGHQAEMEAMGAQGGEYYFKYTSGGEGESLLEDYRANLFIRGLHLEDNTSYRVVFYSKGSDETANMQAGVFRGSYNSERAISMNGDANNEFLLDKTDFTTDRWERNTIMMYYQNDSVANRHMYYSGFWWADEWRVTDPETGKEYNRMEQFDTYFLRFAFRYPARSYYLDDIALYKSTIGGAEFNGDILRVDFGYQTNLGDIAKADPAGAVELPGDYFSLSAEYGGDPYDLDVMSAEYHDDGYLYIWLDDDQFDGLENVRLNFNNPKGELQLKYTGSLYPYSLDTAWVNKGKIVPNFENEFAVFNPEVFAISRIYIAPTINKSNPENGSFNLDVNTETVDVTFSKEVYANLKDGTKDDYNVIIRAKSSKGEEVWTPSAYDPETFTVTFKRPAGGTPLNGDIDFTVMNARAGSGDQYQPAAAETFTLSFGDLGDNRPVIYYDSEVEWAGYGNQYLPAGWTIYDAAAGEAGQLGTGESASGRSRMFTFANGGDFTRGFYTSPRAGSVDGRLVYGTAEGYNLYFEPGEYWLSFKAFQWDKGTHAVTTTSVYLYQLNGEKGDAIGSFRPDDGYAASTAQSGSHKVTVANSYKFTFTIETAGNYVLEFFTPSSAGWSGQCIGALELSNQYSEAFKYLLMLENAQASAEAVLADAKADTKYSGDYLNKFQSVIDDYKGFKDTAPSAYEKATQTIKDATTAMSDRISTVDKFYSEYAAAEAKEAVYTDSTGYNQLVAYKALVDKIAEYEGLDVTVKDNDALTAITAEVTAATKAMTDRCDAIDKFNSTIENAKKTYDDNELLQNLDALVALNNTYGQYKDLDRIAVTEEELKAATDAVQAAIDNGNNAATTYTETTAQLKKLYGLATDLGALLSADIKAQYASTIDDDQNLARLLKLEINKALYQQLAADELEIPAEGIDYSGFITNATLYMVGTLGNQIQDYWYSYSGRTNWRIVAGNEYVDEVFPGWSILTSGSVHAAYGINGIDGGGYAEPGYAKAGGIAADWSSSYTLKQTVIDLPNGVYTLGVNFGAGENNATRQYVIANNDTLAVSSDQGAVANTWENIVVTDNKLDLTAFHTGCNAWSRLDNWSLTLISVDPTTDYAAELAKIDGEIAEIMTNVAPVESDADVKFYNLGGIATEQPEGISIRVTTGKNGARKVEKVLVK